MTSATVVVIAQLMMMMMILFSLFELNEDKGKYVAFADLNRFGHIAPFGDNDIDDSAFFLTGLRLPTQPKAARLTSAMA